MKQKIIRILLRIAILPILVFEYAVFLWFWGGADLFNLIAVPIVFSAYFIGLIYLRNKAKISVLTNTDAGLLMAGIAPILTTATVWLLSFIFGVNITVW